MNETSNEQKIAIKEINTLSGFEFDYFLYGNGLTLHILYKIKELKNFSHPVKKFLLFKDFFEDLVFIPNGFVRKKFFEKYEFTKEMQREYLSAISLFEKYYNHSLDFEVQILDQLMKLDKREANIYIRIFHIIINYWCAGSW